MGERERVYVEEIGNSYIKWHQFLKLRGQCVMLDFWGVYEREKGREKKRVCGEKGGNCQKQ